MIRWPLPFALIAMCSSAVSAQESSVARQWNEELLTAITRDLARPPVHARNLFHVSAAMYDAWSAYDPVSEPFLLGRTRGTYHSAFDGAPLPDDIVAARNEAISYAAYRLLRHRFQNSPGASSTLPALDARMDALEYDRTNTSTDYVNGGPAELGNHIALEYIAFGLTDGSNEAGNYGHLYYTPANPPIAVEEPGNPSIVDPNRWQQITVTNAVDQNGNPVQGTPPPVGHEWGNVLPFALDTALATEHTRNGQTYRVFLDPGPPAFLDTTLAAGLDEFYKWSFCMVPIWQSHLDPDDGTLLDTSPASLGNITEYPTDRAGYEAFYDYFDGGVSDIGREVNPITGQPYAPNIVKRGDYARILAEFWADGPNSETPPGHWFSILHGVMDAPTFERRWMGTGPVLDALEYDVKVALTLGGAMHDAAMAAWSIKGWYDYVRPVSAIRYMADKGQCSDVDIPHYHPAGLPLIPGYIGSVEADDPLVGENEEHLGKIKLFTWRGPAYIDDPETDHAGVGWILAENWWPYQRPTFVTPPFSGYVSGHSTYSRTAAEVLTLVTGSEYFPGGLGVYDAPAGEFLEFESGPSMDIELQWATYRDASDQCSLSRIWGGIHPPVDDIPGRLLGRIIGPDAVALADDLFVSERPWIVSVSCSDSIQNSADIGNTFTVAILYDRPMDQSVEPVIGYLGDEPDPAVALEDAHWSDERTYTMTYRTLPSSLEARNIHLRIDGGTDPLGTQQDVYLAQRPFIVDTKLPALVSITPDVVMINDAVAAFGQFTIVLTFDEACDTTTVPELTFTNGDLTNAIQYDAENSQWNSPVEFVARFGVNDSGEELWGIGCTVTMTRDVAGNAMLTTPTSGLFELDTRNPVLAPLIPDDTTLSLLDVGSSALTIPLIFDEDMDPSAIPAIAFPDDDPLANSLSLNLANTAWITTSEYRIVYDMANANEQFFNITAGVIGAKDLAGNAPEATPVNDLFIVDTHPAQVVSATPVVPMVNNARVGTGGFHIDIAFDEPMDSGFSPLIQLTSAEEMGNSLTYSALQSQWMDASTYRAIFHVLDEEREVHTIGLGTQFARDGSGNIQSPFASSAVFALDTRDPTVLVANSNTYLITDADTGPGAFTVLVVFSESMDTGIQPMLTFDPPASLDGLLTLDPVSSDWLNATTYRWVHDVTPMAASISPIGIAIASGADTVGNTMSTYIDPTYFSIAMSVGLRTVEEQGAVVIYPNPVPRGTPLWLLIPRTVNDVRIEVLDGLGRSVYNEFHKTLSAGRMLLPLPPMASGLGLIRSTTADLQATMKIQFE
jgi:hypothetical protein